MGGIIKMSAVSVLAAVLGTVCIIFPAVSAEGAKSGLILCGNIVIPSLFPFCVLALFCFKSGMIGWISRALSPVSRHVFHLSGEQFCVLLMSCLAGYPVGIKLAHTLYTQGKITLEEAQRMGLYCINAGPAFILTAVGEGMFGDRYYGRILLLGNIIATLIICIIAQAKHKPCITSPTKVAGPLSDAFVESAADASRSMFAICAWVVLFSSVLSIINCGLLPRKICRFFTYTLEVTTGALAAGNNILIIAAILSFCGLCVHCQVYSVAKEAAPPYSKFLAFRALHAAISVLFTYIFLKADDRAVHTITNNINIVRNNVSFTYASAAALILLSMFLCFSVSERKNMKFM